MKKTHLFAILTVFAIVFLFGMTTFSTVTQSQALSEVAIVDSSAFNHSAMSSNEWPDPIDQGLITLLWTDPVDQ